MAARDLVRLVGGGKNLGEFLRQQSLVEGVWSGRKGWLAIGAVVWSARGLRKAFRREPQLLLREVLKPGQQLLVSEAITRPTRRQRRRRKATR